MPPTPLSAQVTKPADFDILLGSCESTYIKWGPKPCVLLLGNIASSSQPPLWPR